MKKILLGLFILSSLSFANQTWPNEKTATIPVTVTAEIINPNTQIAIFDETNTTLLQELSINHGSISSANFNPQPATGNFVVRKSEDNSALFISSDALTFEVTAETALSLPGKNPALKANLTTPKPLTGISTTSTDPQTITSTLSKITSDTILEPGKYTSSGATLTVTLSKTTEPTPGQ